MHASPTRVWRARGKPLWLGGIGTVLALLLGPGVGGCSAPDRDVWGPVFRLTDHREKPLGDTPARCSVDDEFRPSFGCPAVRLLDAALVGPGPGDRPLRVVARTPLALRDRSLIVRPTLRPGAGTDPVTLAPQAVEATGADLTIDIPPSSAPRGDEASAYLEAYPPPPSQRRFHTQPLEIPRQAELTVGVALAGFARPGQAAATEFVLTAREAGSGDAAAEHRREDREILRHALGPGDGGAWHDLRVDLGDLAGRTVTFTFATNTTSPQEQTTAGATSPVWGAPEIRAPRARGKRRNLVLISLDTVRADHLGGAFGGVRVAPWFDRLSREGTTFTQAITTFHSTSASHMSLFTGTYPAVHKVEFATHSLSPGRATFPEILARAGYTTGAVTENAMLLAASGFARGFDQYRENRDTLRGAGGIEETFDDGIAWLQRHRDDLFFLFLHTYEAHRPYAPDPALLAELPEVEVAGRDAATIRRERLRRAYAAEVRNADRALERLWAALEDLDVLDETLVVITSDHGDAFGEHRLWGHGKALYDEVLRVPLLFWAPGLIPAGLSLDGQVSLVDVAPTILELLGQTPPLRLQGRSLVHALRGDPLRGHGVRFAEGRYGGKRLIAARTTDHKWIWREETGAYEVYDLRADPGEQTPLDDASLSAEGRALIEAYRGLDGGAEPPTGARGGETASPAEVLDGQTRRKLEALGYVE